MAVNFSLKACCLAVIRFAYIRAVKPFFFLFDAEAIHNLVVSFGKCLGNIHPLKCVLKVVFSADNFFLAQSLHGIDFKNPVGLAAGFDYEAKLVKILPAVGFGFETIGTVTNQPCPGNLKPRLGRLVKSRALLVNKGFKNLGITKTLEKLEKIKFEMPAGLSIGVTNTENITKQEDAVSDIVEAFLVAERSGVKFSHYELNISCPNLRTNVEFYSPDNLEKLLSGVTNVNPSKPIFIKMPINKTDGETLEMLKVISGYPISGVVFGNLQKDRRHPLLDPLEVARSTKGNFSGAPTKERSNELIALTRANYGKRFTIIGCGGVFGPKDAYEKIKLGASLVELITGMIFEGPQLIGEINLGLAELLRKDGYKNISEAVGVGISGGIEK